MINSVNKLLDAFISGDYFILFLVLTLAILVVLVLALVKSREEYNELLTLEFEKNNKKKENENNINIKDSATEDNYILDELESLMAKSQDDVFDENKPLIKQIDVSNVKSYDDIIEDYELSEEENAVISAEELERKTKERLDTLGNNDNQIAIAKYEEEQEKKAIISYEQLLKNASNISLSYKEEETKGKDAPKVNKIEVEQKEVVGAEIYLEEEEFLKILKEFRTSL